MAKQVLCVLGLIGALSLAGPAWAVSYDWAGAANGDWDAVGNWEDAGNNNPTSIAPPDDYTLDAGDHAGASHGTSFGAQLSVAVGSTLEFKTNYNGTQVTASDLRLAGGRVYRNKRGSTGFNTSSTVTAVTGTDTEFELGNQNYNQIIIDGLLQGNGAITKTGARVLSINNTGNTFSGLVEIDAGTVNVKTTALDDATVTVNGGALSGVSSQGSMTLTTLNLNGGKLAGGGANWTLNTTSFVAQAPSTVEVTNSSRTLTLNDSIQGDALLTKTSVGVLQLSDDCSGFSGGWDVAAGRLRAAVASALGTGNVTVQPGAILELDNDASISNECGLFLEEDTGSYGRTQLDADPTVSYLSLDGVYQPAGVYDSSDFPTYLTGSGTLTVLNSGPPAETAPIAEPVGLALMGLGALAAKRRRR